MSIIYDALKKTQTNREEKASASSNIIIKPKKTRLSKWVDFILIMLVISLLIITVYAYFPRPGNHTSTVSATSTSPSLVQLKKDIKVNSTVSIPGYKLNGVFLSEKNSIAMINNESYKLGDVLDGMKIISISLNKVTLQNDNDIVELTQV